MELTETRGANRESAPGGRRCGHASGAAGKPRRTLVVVDRGERVEYALGPRPGRGRGGGFGWTERVSLPGARPTETAVCAAEVMAVLGDHGRGEEAAELTLAAADALERRGDRAGAGRLRGEVEAGRNLERLSLRPVQTRMLERLVEGWTLAEMAARGGFLQASGRADTSWLQRRAGLVPQACSKTGKVRRARTARYDVYVALVRAVGGDPHEFGV
jgi:hypothetical protein